MPRIWIDIHFINKVALTAFSESAPLFVLFRFS